MTFSKALELLKEGKKLHRKNWNGKTQYIELAVSVMYKTMDNSTLAITNNSSIIFHGTQGVQVGWLASQADMLSNDWEVIE